MNNNQWEALVKLIIPAILLIFWVINQVFRKDLTAPRAPRNFPPGERPNPLAPPSGDRFGGAPVPRAPRPRSNRERPPRPDEEIVIISSEDRGTRPRPSPSRGGPGAPPSLAPQQGKRSRPSSSSKPKQKSTADLMAGLIGDQTLMIGPLSEVQGMEQVHLEVGSAAMMRPQKRADTTEMVQHTSLIDIRRAFRSPKRLREAFLMSELLQPPVSKRGPRR